MRVAIYGGSFNPPHIGHGMVAAWLRWTDFTDQVWLMPTFSHAFSKSLADFTERLAWCAALAEDVGPWVQVTDIEQKALNVIRYEKRTSARDACIFDEGLGENKCHCRG